MADSEELTKGSVTGSGAIAQGDGAQAVGAGGILINGNVVDSKIVIYQGAQVVIPSAEAIAKHRLALKAQLEKDASTRWGGMSFYIQEEGVTLPIEASPYQAGQTGARENLQSSLKTARRMLVLGDPGSGKTVALERLAWELCNEKEQIIPVIIKLDGYGGGTLSEWVRTLLQKCGCLRLDDEKSLTVFLWESGAHFVFLFDGLNEVPPEFRQQLIEKLKQWISAYPGHSVIVTSRVQDESWLKFKEDLPAVVVQPVQPEKALAYLKAHLGDEKGNGLYNRLGERLLALARNPLVLWLIKEAGVEGESLPGNRGELYKRFVERMLDRDNIRGMNTQIIWSDKQQSLKVLALHMSQKQRLLCPRDEALAVIVADADIKKRGYGNEDRADTLITACAQSGLLAGDKELRFAPHQTLQEHFTALALREIVNREQRMSFPLRLWRETQNSLNGRKSGLAALAAQDWWWETLVQLAGIYEDSNWLVRSLAQTNPWLALWCADEGKPIIEDTRIWIEKQSTRMLESHLIAERRKAVQALAQTRNERIVKPLLKAAADEDEEVSRLALQGLVSMITLVEDLLRARDQNTWNIAIKCFSEGLESPFSMKIADHIKANDILLAEARSRLKVDAPISRRDKSGLLSKLTAMNALARIESGKISSQFWKDAYGEPEWVTIPAGEFWMGSDNGRYADEKPAHKLYLPEYQIARVPITNAQYALYVKDAKVKPPDHWRGRSVPPGRENRPVVNVTWHDAIAYCKWLGGKIKKPVTLPSEAEWEKAARGDKDKRAYPWGDDWRELHCNSSELGLDATTPVGLFLNGASPYGCLDMSGNAWEWTRSVWDIKYKYPYKIEDGRENLSQKDLPRTLRGGAFDDFSDYARCAYRLRNLPSYGRNFIGFRVVFSPVLLTLNSGL